MIRISSFFLVQTWVRSFLVPLILCRPRWHLISTFIYFNIYVLPGIKFKYWKTCWTLPNMQNMAVGHQMTKLLGTGEVISAHCGFISSSILYMDISRNKLQQLQYSGFLIFSHVYPVFFQVFSAPLILRLFWAGKKSHLPIRLCSPPDLFLPGQTVTSSGLNRFAFQNVSLF